MAIVYYVHTAPGSFIATAANDEPTNGPLVPPMFPVAQNVYQQELHGIWQAINIGDLHLQVSRDKDREGPKDLSNATLDLGKTYAIFLPDLPDLGYTQVVFDLDTVPFHTETGAPWDYNGTDGFGFNQKVSFGAAATHTIDAHVTYGGGTFIVSATFDVD